MSSARCGLRAALAPDHGHYRLMEGAVDTDWDLAWEQVQVPVLNVTGLRDRMFLDLDDVEALAGSIPDLRREDWPDAGHLLPMECPARVADSLLAFLDALRVAGGKVEEPSAGGTSVGGASAANRPEQRVAGGSSAGGASAANPPQHDPADPASPPTPRER